MNDFENLKQLIKKYNLLSIQASADLRGLTYGGMKKRIESGKENTIKIGHLILVCND